MIIKNTPQTLDKSSDYRLVASTAMIDALNVLIDSDELGPLGSEQSLGDSGVIKNVRGNRAVYESTWMKQELFADQDEAFNAINIVGDGQILKVIGATVDRKMRVAYLFVWSNVITKHCVLLYDPYGKLPNLGPNGTIDVGNMGGSPGLRMLHMSSKFNFPEHGFVKGDVVYTANSFMLEDAIADLEPEQVEWINDSRKRDFEKDILLYFTDNVNEPRKLNIFKCLFKDISDYDQVDLIDFITACPRTPLTPIEFTFVNESEIPADFQKGIDESYFKTLPGFQFAYQYIYDDGMETAISPYSDIAFPPSIVQQGVSTSPDHDQYNVCALSLPFSGKEISRVRIVARQGNGKGNVGRFFIIDEFDPREDKSFYYRSSVREYYFRNDQVLKGVSEEEVNKQFDAVPRKAEAQTIHSNRLMYGNYLDGFDNVETECTYSIEYQDRPLEGVTGTTLVRPTILEVGPRNNSYPTVKEIYNGGTLNINATKVNDPHVAPAMEVTSNAINKSAGVRVDLTGLPTSVSEGTLITVTIKVSPKRNYHLYEARNSYHQSRHLGERDGHDYGTPEAAELVDFETENFGSDQLAAQNESSWSPIAGSTLETRLDQFHTASESGGSFLKKATNDNTVQNNPTPSSGEQDGGVGPSYFGKNAGIGQSAVDADACPFYSSWKYLDSNGEVQTERAFYGTSAANPLIIRGETLSFTAKFRYIADVGGVARQILASAIEDAFCFGSIDSTTTGNIAYAIELVDPPQRVATLEYDLGLSNFQSIPVESSFAHLICGLQSKEVGASDVEVATTNIPPQGYFIINRINADFRFTHPKSPVNSDGQDAELILTMGKVNDLEVMTCVKPLLDEFHVAPWRVISAETMQAYHTDPSIFFPADPADSPLNLQGLKFEPTNSEKDFFILKSSISNSEKDHITNHAFNHTLFTALGPHKCFGYLNLHTSNRNFVRTLSESDLSTAPFYPGEPTFQPKSLFPNFTLLDGYGGPGGKSEGNKLTYDNAGLAERGSIYGSQVLEDNTKIYDGDEITGWNPYEEAGDEVFLTSYAGGCGFVFRFHGKDEDGEYPDKTENAIFTLSNFGESLVTALTDDDRLHLSYYAGPFFTGDIRVHSRTQPNSYNSTDPFGRTVLPLVTWNHHSDLSLTEEVESCYRVPRVLSDVNENYYQRNIPIGPLNNTQIFSAESIPSLNFQPKHSFLVPVGGNSGFIDSTTVGSSFRSFKTKANHEFGVVYYDQRGRHGFVNPLANVYVPGYSDAERGDEKGKVNIKLNLLHDPPSWATNYKIVYTKNTSIEKFVQYSAGGAFTAFENEVAPEATANIYVSLNYLQHHPISYVSSFGARPPEGGLDLYKFKQGDILRVLSYALPVLPGEGVTAVEAAARIYPQDFEFEVIDYVLLDINDNPLHDTNDPVSSTIGFPEAKKGAFVVLRDNPNADGFNYNDVNNGGHKWGDNCIFEIASPKKQSDEEDKIYYEISETFNVVLNEDNDRVHEVSSVVLEKGDVFFRPYAVNTRSLIANPSELPDSNTVSSQGFRDLLINSTGNQQQAGSKSRFKTFFLETESANDLFRSDSSLIGRPNVYLPDALEVRREATITYSDPSNPSSRKVNYASFNSSLANFKDLPEKHGDIHYMVEQDDGIFVIQTNKCSKVPVGRNLIQSAAQAGILTSTTAVLGTEYFYAGVAGCDFNPESVTVIDNSVYFAHKSLGKVFRFTEGVGVEDISAIKMGSFFRRLFARVMEESQFINHDDVRIIGGYDPDKGEFLITVMRPQNEGPVISVPGCTDPEADNYDSNATFNDGSCLYTPDPEPILGCTDPTALNYDPTATQDDGTCVLPIYGCTDPSALNYNPDANVNDGSCEYPGGGDDEEDVDDPDDETTTNPFNPNISDIGPIVIKKDKK